MGFWRLCLIFFTGIFMGRFGMVQFTLIGMGSVLFSVIGFSVIWFAVCVISFTSHIVFLGSVLSMGSILFTFVVFV